MSFQKIERVEEVWKPIEGFANYEVSNTGKIKRRERKITSIKTGKEMRLKEKVMKQRWNKNCKCFFLDLLNDEEKRKTVYPHKEVAKAFCINVLPEEFTMIVHLDNDPKNNNSTNLEWVTPSEHMAFQFQVGNKNNFKVWETRKKKYSNGFKKAVSHKKKAREEATV
ncbi:MAG: NUMOD4 domain-containing protein [Cyclobacteriaceae bacterium]